MHEQDTETFKHVIDLFAATQAKFTTVWTYCTVFLLTLYTVPAWLVMQGKQTFL